MLKATEAEAPSVLATFARRFDLSVLMQSEPNVVNNDDMIETSLLESGRPLVVVPYIQREGLQLNRVICCWDGSRAATRAINDALPLLVRAGTIDLLIVLNEKTGSEEHEIRGIELEKHFARHDVKVEIENDQSSGHRRNRCHLVLCRGSIRYTDRDGGLRALEAARNHSWGCNARYVEVDDRSNIHVPLTTSVAAGSTLLQALFADG